MQQIFFINKNIEMYGKYKRQGDFIIEKYILYHNKYNFYVSYNLRKIDDSAEDMKF